MVRRFLQNWFGPALNRSRLRTPSIFPYCAFLSVWVTRVVGAKAVTLRTLGKTTGEGNYDFLYVCSSLGGIGMNFEASPVPLWNNDPKQRLPLDLANLPLDSLVN